ncbi:MAG TPA: hypothetical protein VFH31_11940 [Pyrinomonadaceae bacterium]|nr:hypothetical protein [Pyrinomonadaceae bacterium]
MQFPSRAARVSLRSSNVLSAWGVSLQRLRWLWISLLITCLSGVGYLVYQRNSALDSGRDRDLEVRLDFNPFLPRRDFRDRLSMTLHGDGKVRVVHHRLEMFVDAVYEGTLAEADAISFVSRTKQASREWRMFAKRRPEARDGSLFRMLVVPKGSSDEKNVFGGTLDDASESTRSLVEDLLGLWKRLEKAPAAQAYLRSVPFVEPELKRIQQNEDRRFLSVSEFPVNLQQPMTESLNRPRDFLPITRAQHDQLLEYRQFIVTAKGFSYRLSLSLPAPNN